MSDKNYHGSFFLFKLFLIITNFIGCFSLLAFTYYLTLSQFFGITFTIVVSTLACLVLQFLAQSGFEYGQSLLKREKPDYTAFFGTYFLSFTSGMISFVFLLKISKYLLATYFGLEYKWLDF